MYLRAVGGEVGATSSLAPKIGPLGLVRDPELLVDYDNAPLLCLFSLQKRLEMTLLKLPVNGRVSVLQLN